MGYLDGFGVIVKKWFGVNTDSGARVTLQYPEEVRPKPERFHGRHVLNRYEDGMEKCIGCELCAGVCPAKCIYVRGADNDPDDPTSPGERFGYVYEINYLRCIHCDLCVEACPTEAITETKLFEFSFTNRDDAIYTKDELLVGDDGRPRQLPWENWDGGFDPARDTSGWMRATAPQGDANFKGLVAWAGELGYGVRPPERALVLEETGPVPSVAHGHHDDHDDHIAETPDVDAGADAVEAQTIDVPTLEHAMRFDVGDVTATAAETYEAAGDLDAASLIGQEDLPATAAKFEVSDKLGTAPVAGRSESDLPPIAADDDSTFDSAARFNDPTGGVETTDADTSGTDPVAGAEPAWFSPDDVEGATDAPYAGAAEFNAPVVEDETTKRSRRRRGRADSDQATAAAAGSALGDDLLGPDDDDLTLRSKSAFGDRATDEELAQVVQDLDASFGDEGSGGGSDDGADDGGGSQASSTEAQPEATAEAAAESALGSDISSSAPAVVPTVDPVTDAPDGGASDGGASDSDGPTEPEAPVHHAGHFDAPEVDEPEPKKKRRFRR